MSSANGKLVLVAGGAGFLGSHLCDALLADGARVICLDNLKTGRTENLRHLKREPRFSLVEADIFFNSAFEWSTAVGGDSQRFDLESVAVHEIGHFLGLGHSAIGETERLPEGGRRVLGSGAVMFPISLGRGAVADRALQPDDLAGVSDLYPDGGFRSDTGIVTGRVRMDGAAVKGAHVVAFDPRTGSLIGNFSSADGTFRIAGLSV